MIKTRKKVVGALAAAMAMTFAVGAVLGLPERQTASAARSTSAWVTVGEIYNDDTSNFKAAELGKLYQALAGEDVTTIEGLGAKLDEAGGALTSADFRTAGGGENNVSVYFGGMKWDAVYLTEATDGDIILDLWRSADDLKSTDTAMYSNDWLADEDIDPNETSVAYPANMYSTSKIRVDTLNAGGQYSNDGGETLAERHEQDANNQYARFTMSGITGSLTQYLAKPSEVGYQANEWNTDVANVLNAYSTEYFYYHPNDAYETPASGGIWDGNSNYGATGRDDVRADGAKYGSWKDDYVWLPSALESGYKMKPETAFGRPTPLSAVWIPCRGSPIVGSAPGMPTL